MVLPELWLSTYVVQEKKPAAVVDFKTEKRFSVPSFIDKYRICSALSVPMLIGDEVFGVLIGHTLAQRKFTEAEVSLYQTMANQAAVAIENLFLRREHERRERPVWKSVVRTMAQDPGLDRIRIRAVGGDVADQQRPLLADHPRGEPRAHLLAGRRLADPLVDLDAEVQLVRRGVVQRDEERVGLEDRHHLAAHGLQEVGQREHGAHGSGDPVDERQPFRPAARLAVQAGILDTDGRQPGDGGHGVHLFAREGDARRVRRHAHVLQRVYLVGGGAITASLLLSELHAAAQKRRVPSGPFHETIDNTERELLQEALQAAGGNKSAQTSG